MTTDKSDQRTAAHDCGLCDAPLKFAGMAGEHTQWDCTDPECGWTHTSIDCCYDDADKIPAS
jgi:hypothetical protein